MIVETENEIYETELELLQIEITGCCNMKCKHCRAAFQPKNYISLEQVNKIFDFANSVKSENFKLNLSGGEPFMHPKLYDILKLAVEKGINEVVITSNASLITDDWLKKLSELKFKFLCIQVSMDSVDENEHDKFRNYQGAFKKCNEVLEKIENYSNINSSIRMTVTKDTIEQVDKMIEYAVLKKCKILGISSVIPFGKAQDGNLSFKNHEKMKLMDLIINKREQYNDKIEIVTEDPLKFPMLYDKNKLNFNIDITDSCVFGGCTAGISSLNINSDGSVTPCSMMDELVFNINDCNDVDEMIQKYQNSEIIKKLFSKKYLGKCGNCYLKQICGGCRAVAKAYTDNFMGSDLSCWRKNEKL